MPTSCFGNHRNFIFLTNSYAATGCLLDEINKLLRRRKINWRKTGAMRFMEPTLRTASHFDTIRTTGFSECKQTVAATLRKSKYACYTLLPYPYTPIVIK